MSHTTTTNSQSHHNCTPACRAKPWGWYLCLQTNAGHLGALQKEPCPPSTHTADLPIPAVLVQSLWRPNELVRTFLQFSTKPPRSCNSPYKPSIIEEISSCRQQVEAHKSCPCNTHSKWIHQEAGCGKSGDITHKKSKTAEENRWTNYKNWRKNNFTALQSASVPFKERNLKKNRREEKNTPPKKPKRFTPLH